MAAKRKRKRARKAAASHPRKKRRAVKRRRAVKAKTSSVRRRKRRSGGHVRRASPRRRRRAVATSHRARRSAPSRPRRSGRRRARRNPGIPLWAQAALAAGAAVATFAVVSAGAFALTQRLDPTMATAARNRNIVSGLATAGGLALAATKSPLFGVGIAAGGFVLLAGSQLGIKLSSLLAKSSGGTVPIGAVYGNLGAYQPMGAVYGNIGAYEPMGAVYGNLGAYEPMGQAFVPAPPWQGNPFAN